jgi:NitT/TauT family transport system substrate-binding protein
MNSMKASDRSSAVDAVPPRLPVLTRLVASLAAGALVLAACGDSAEDGAAGDTDAGDGALDEVTFLTIVPPESLTFAPELYATASGYFAENDLAVDLRPVRGSPQAIQGVLSELALISRVGDIEIIGAVGERGADQLVSVGSVFKDSTIRFVSSPEDPLSSADDLVGQLIGIPSEGGTSELTIDLVGRAGGVEELDKQVVGLSPGTFDLVEDGRIAGYAVSLDTAVLLEQTRDAVVLNPGDSIFSGGQVYMSNRTALEDEEDDSARDIVERFLLSVGQAIDDIVADQDNDFANVLETLRGSYSFDSLMDDDIAVGSLEQFVRSWTLDGEENILRNTEERWQGVYDELVEIGTTEPGLDPAAWYTNEYLPDSDVP